MSKIKSISIQVSCFLVPCFLMAQNIYPQFTNAAYELRFSKSIPGVMDDDSYTEGDSISYQLNGQLFENEEGKIQKASEGFNGQSNRATPWETLSELIFAYENRDASKVIDLYDKSSKIQAEAVFRGPNAQKVFDQLGNTGNVYVLAGFEYKKGYFAISESENLGIVTNYFIKENDEYKLSALQDKSPQTWNVAVYFKFKPEPLINPELISFPDSVNINDNFTLEFKLQKNDNWIILFREKTGEPVIRMIQDNGEGDESASRGRIRFSVETIGYFNIGENEILAQESNYPIQRVTPDIINNATKIPIKVYEIIE